jgi:hypothetical protein
MIMQFVFTLLLLRNLSAGNYLWVAFNTFFDLWVSWNLFGQLNDWGQPGRTRKQLAAWVERKAKT